MAEKDTAKIKKRKPEQEESKKPEVDDLDSLPISIPALKKEPTVLPKENPSTTTASSNAASNTISLGKKRAFEFETTSRPEKKKRGNGVLVIIYDDKNIEMYSSDAQAVDPKLEKLLAAYPTVNREHLMDIFGLRKVIDPIFDESYSTVRLLPTFSKEKTGVVTNKTSNNPETTYKLVCCVYGEGQWMFGLVETQSEEENLFQDAMPIILGDYRRHYNELDNEQRDFTDKTNVKFQLIQELTKSLRDVMNVLPAGCSELNSYNISEVSFHSFVINSPFAFTPPLQVNKTTPSYVKINRSIENIVDDL